jgi:AraC-like DNA-binding protein
MLMLFNAGSSVDLREYSEKRPLEADQSSLLVSLPGEVRAMVLTFKSGVRYRIVLIECDLKLLSEEKLCMGSLLPEPLNKKSKSNHESRFRHRNLTKSMMELVYKCETLGGEGISRRIALEAFSKELIALGLDSLTSSDNEKKALDVSMSAAERDAVFKAADILRKEFVHPPLQRNLSKRVGLNLNKLSLCFQEVYGVTINKFVLNLKLEKAKSLLSSENKPTVGEVASEIGFNNTSYFIRKFRAAYGQTPGEFV